MCTKAQMNTNAHRRIIYDFFKKSYTNHYSEKEVLYRSSAQEGRIFYLLEGYVKSYFISSDGVYNNLALYIPGSIFPLSPMLRMHAGRSSFHIDDTVYFEAMTPSTAASAPFSSLVAYCDEKPSAYKELLLSAVINYELYLSRIEASLLRHALQRVAHQLISLARLASTEVYGQYIIDVPLTHQDIASNLGMARETVSREIETLREKGLIETKDKHIVIRDMDELMSIVTTAK